MQISIRDDLSQVEQAWVDTINSRDRERFLKHHSENVVLYDPTVQQLKGRSALGNLFDGLFSMFPDYHIKKTRVFGQEGWVCLEVEESGTMKGPIHAGKSEIPPTGKSFRIPSSIVCHVENGLISEVRIYYDLMGLMSQLGLGP